MQIRDAIRRSIKSYWKGREPEELRKVSKGKTKYNKKYFDKIDSEFHGKDQIEEGVTDGE